MKWRAFTIINCVVAVLTISAVSLDLYCTRKRVGTSAQAASRNGDSASNRSRGLEASAPTQISRIQLDAFATVAPPQFYEMLAKANPAELNALALKFNGLPNNSRSEQAVGMFFQTWAELDGKAAIEGAFLIKPPDLRQMAIATVIHSASGALLPDIAAFIISHPHNDLIGRSDGLLSATVERWSNVDPPAAAKFLDETLDPASITAYDIRKDVAESWGSLDPAAALAWIDKEPVESENDPLLNCVVKGWSRNDAAAAGAYIVSHPDAPGVTDAAATVVSALLKQDPTEAMTWVNDLPAGELRNSTEEALVQEWIDANPVAATHWLDRLSGDDRKLVARSIGGIWSSRNAAAAQEWLTTLTGGDIRDNAIAGAVGDYGSNSPHDGKAFTLAASISDPKLRSEILEKMIESLPLTYAPQAAAWIKSSSLSRKEKEELLSLHYFSSASDSE